MQITVSLDNCSHCRHRDHSGAFTPGGAKQICGYPNISDYVLKYVKGTKHDDPNGFEFRPKGKERERLEKQCYHWKNRIVEDHMEGKDSFPVFCPLKHGECY
jgi:hypothetical protein